MDAVVIAIIFEGLNSQVLVAMRTMLASKSFHAWHCAKLLNTIGTSLTTNHRAHADSREWLDQSC